MAGLSHSVSRPHTLMCAATTPSVLSHTIHTDTHKRSLFFIHPHVLSLTHREPHAHRRPTLCRIGIIHHILQLTAFYLSWVILHPGSVTGTRHRQPFWQPAFCVLEDAALCHCTLAFIVWERVRACVCVCGWSGAETGSGFMTTTVG